MGDLYQAEDTELRREVAIKVLAERFAHDPSVRERFKREALTSARLSSHPRVVTIYDVGEWAERPFIVMQWLPGGTLADRIKAGRVGAARALDWLDQAAEALDASHAERIVHRDVKPANLLLDGRGEVHVGDFGIARALDESTGGMTETGTVLGTAGYLAPEQAKGETATHASDVYSLAVVAYELLTGRRPFESTSPTAEAAAHINDPVPPASAGGEVPPSVDAVFERALAKDPGQRQPSARQLVDDLREALAQDEQSTRAFAAPAAAPPRRRRPAWVFALAAALALLAAGGVTGALVATSGDGKRRTRAVVHTITRTLPGTTISRTRTVTTAAPAPPPPPPPPPPASASSGHTLNDRGYALMQQGAYAQALAPLQQAVQALRGTGPSDPYEAYANYNLAYTLIQLGRCSEALPLLDRSEQLQGYRKEIASARKRAQKCA
jgi:eukaryotic-like serine/threonine-protein kinase